MSADPYLGSLLHRFLEERRVRSHDRTHEWSMTGMGDVKGKWMVSDVDYPMFLDMMHEYLVLKNFRPNNFVEQRRADGVTPLLIDLDFKYPTERSLQRTFTADNIKAFIQDIIVCLKECFELKDRDALRFFVTLRPQPYADPKSVKKEIKDGVHILCPDFSVTPEHHALIRWLLLERDAVKKAFDATGYTNKDDDVFDKSLVAKNGWFFYGESKPSIPPYLLTNVFKYNTRSGKLLAESPDQYGPRELIERLSIRYKLKPLLTVADGSKDFVNDCLAKINTVVMAPQPTGEQIMANQQDTAGMIGMLPVIMDSFNQIVSTEDEIAMAKDLAINCLSIERAENYETWMRVGWCLRNIDSSESMFDAWMAFSAKSDKSRGNNIEGLRREWMRGTMKRINGSPGLKMGSLKMWAREDSPTEYSKLMDGDIISFITKAAMTFKGGTHHHVAKMVHKLFYDRYKCTVEGRSTEWYEFKDHVWNPMPQGILMKQTITDEITIKVDSARLGLKAPDVLSCPPEEYQDKMKAYNDSIVKLLKLQENLYNANFKDSVMKEAVQLFYDSEFYKRINQNSYLIGCANGILNLRETVFDDAGNPVRYKPTLHMGTPSDYVTLKAGVTADAKDAIEYHPYDPEDPKQKEIMEFFSKLFPAEDLREYVLTLAAGCLEGANREQCFYIMTGSGGNGKSKFVDLMLSVLGQYAGSLASTALTRKRPESGAANPDIMSIKGCRFVEMKEPDEGEPINSARMKQFSGEDFVEARGLFKDQERFKITGKIFLACNRMPPIHSMDGGTWRRIRVIPFDSKFLPAGDPMIDPSRNMYPRDDMIDEKMKSWRNPFFSLLVHYYETKYCPNGIKKVPAIVLQASENYKGSYDVFGKFIKTRVRRENGCDDPPTFKTFWTTYKNWHQDQSGKRLSENEFRIRLNDMYQAPKDGKTYEHIRLFTSDEEAEEYDAALAE
jgi:P4 family phage/plasmid primase-like protien